MDLKVKPFVNKKNGQINVSLNRKYLPKKLLDNINEIKEIKVSLKEWKLKGG